jgi:hypothetical protein
VAPPDQTKSEQEVEALATPAEFFHKESLKDPLAHMDILWAGGVNNPMDFVQRMVGRSNATRLVDRFRNNLAIGLAQTFKSATPHHVSNERRSEGLRRLDCIGSIYCNFDLESIY